MNGEEFQYVIADIDDAKPLCPYCKLPLTTVEYFTGENYHASARNIGYTRVITSSYINITKHLGGYCRHCIKRNLKRSQKSQIISLVVGIILLAIAPLSSVGVIPAYTDGTLKTILIIAMIAAAFLMLYGAAGLFEYVTYHPNKPSGESESYHEWIAFMRAQGKAAFELRYFSPEEKSKLT